MQAWFSGANGVVDISGSTSNDGLGQAAGVQIVVLDNFSGRDQVNYFVSVGGVSFAFGAFLPLTQFTGTQPQSFASTDVTGFQGGGFGGGNYDLLSGAAEAVPEPSAETLLAGVMLGIGVVRRSRLVR